MPQFLILAKDEKDDDALQRRLSVRQNHLDRMKVELEKAIFITGGATLDDQGTMNGSMLVIDIEDMASAVKWINADPYVLGRVWGSFEVLPFRMAKV